MRGPRRRGEGVCRGGRAGRARGPGRRAARGRRGGAGGALAAAPAPNKVCFDEKRLCLLSRVGRRLLVAPGSGRAMAAVSAEGPANKGGRAAEEHGRGPASRRERPSPRRGGPGAERRWAARGGRGGAAGRKRRAEPPGPPLGGCPLSFCDPRKPETGPLGARCPGRSEPAGPRRSPRGSAPVAF